MLTHFAPLDYWLWFTSFALESVGAFYAFRKYPRIRPLWLLLGVASISEAYTFGAALRGYYEWAAWQQAHALYPFMGLLAVNCCGEMLRDRRETITFYSSAIAGVFLMAIAWTWGIGPLGNKTFLELEIIVDSICGILILIGLVQSACRKLPWKTPWLTVSVGLLIWLSSDWVAAMLEHRLEAYGWDVVARIYPIGQCIGVAGITLGVIMDELTEVALPLGHRVIGERVGRVQ